MFNWKSIGIERMFSKTQNCTSLVRLLAFVRWNFVTWICIFSPIFKLNAKVRTITIKAILHWRVVPWPSRWNVSQSDHMLGRKKEDGEQMKAYSGIWLASHALSRHPPPPKKKKNLTFKTVIHSYASRTLKRGQCTSFPPSQAKLISSSQNGQHLRRISVSPAVSRATQPWGTSTRVRMPQTTWHEPQV